VKTVSFKEGGKVEIDGGSSSTTKSSSSSSSSSCPTSSSSSSSSSCPKSSSSSSSSSDCSGKTTVEVKKTYVTGQIFEVGLASKCGHPWEHRILDSTRAWMVNGSLGKTIHVKRGNTYLFKVNQSADAKGIYQHHLYFTTDPIGGKRGEACDNGMHDACPLALSPSPIASGSVALKIHDTYPDTFYYQCRNHKAMGGLVVVDK